MTRQDHYKIAMSPITYWCRIWQMQMEFGLRMWGAWAANIPHANARTLSAEAEAMHTPPAEVTPKAMRPRQPGSRALR